MKKWSMSYYEVYISLDRAYIYFGRVNIRWVLWYRSLGQYYSLHYFGNKEFFINNNSRNTQKRFFLLLIILYVVALKLLNK